MELTRKPWFSKCLTGFALKRIAVVSMLIDHFGSVIMDGVVAPYMQNGYLYLTAAQPFMVRYAPLIKAVCNAVGRTAFPIFCFLLVEGFVHSHDRVRYGVRMGVFALLSEIPYDLARYGAPFNFAMQNVMFTLCIGIFTLLLLDRIENTDIKDGPRRALMALSVIAGMALAFFIRAEYVFLGVLAIALLYLLRSRGRFQLFGLAPLLIVSPWVLLAAVPIALYNGEKGRGGKYAFYILYPAHLLLFAGIAHLLAQR